VLFSVEIALIPGHQLEPALDGRGTLPAVFIA